MEILFEDKKKTSILYIKKSKNILKQKKKLFSKSCLFFFDLKVTMFNVQRNIPSGAWTS